MADKDTEDFKKWLDALEDLKNNPKKKVAAPVVAEKPKAKKPSSPRKSINLGRIFRKVVVAGLLGGTVYGLGAGFTAPHHDAVGTVTNVNNEVTSCGCGDENGDGKTTTYKVNVEGMTTDLSESDVNGDKLVVGDKVTLNVHEAGGFFHKHIEQYKGKAPTPKP